MKAKALAFLTTAVAAGLIPAVVPWAAAGTSAHRGYEPVLNPKDFVRLINNPHYPLPVSRTLNHRGVPDRQTQTDRVHATSGTKVIERITGTTLTAGTRLT